MTHALSINGLPENYVWQCGIDGNDRSAWPDSENMVIQHVSQRIPTWLKILEHFFADQPISMLEIGVYRGGWMSRMMRSNLIVESFTGCDPYSGGEEDPYTGTYWQGQRDAQSMYENVFKLYEDQGQTLIRMTSKAFAEQHNPGTFYNAVFIDGDHRYEQCLADAKRFWPFVKPNGLLMFDDYANTDHPGVTKAINDFIEIYKEQIELLIYFGCFFTNLNKVAPVLNGQICLRKCF